jgi:hypothetical protein
MEGAVMYQTFKILILPSLLTFVIVAAGLMGLMRYLSHESLHTTYFVKSLQQSAPCLLCHDGSFDRESLRVAWLPCQARAQAN